MPSQQRPISLRSPARHIYGVGRWLATASVLAWLVAPTSGMAFPDYFSPVVRESSDLSMFKKWARVRQSHPADLERSAGLCQDAATCRPMLWRHYLDRVKNLPRSQRIAEVHRLFNNSPYITDMVNWGMQDYWETPLEFLLQSGDCEDYAIVKYMMLRASGIEAEDMRIVVLQDTSLNEMHAVLVVNDGGEAMVLDNFQRNVISSRRIRHYRPIFAVNEKQWWRH